MTRKDIRNFVITAHIDHGKSTLADRLLELTGTIPKEKLREQYLDRNPIERERGITIKLAPVRMRYKIPNSNVILANEVRPGSHGDAGQASMTNSSEYILNLIDTPGHVDFSYEVSRSLSCVEGAILLVDGVAGIQAQTVSNLHQAKKQNLAIIAAVNKIDLPNADPAKTAQELHEMFGFKLDKIYFISAKTAENVDKLLEGVIDRIPPPDGEAHGPLRALVFDSHYDQFKGVITYIRIFDGAAQKGDEIVFLGSGAKATIIEVGVFTPELSSAAMLSAGEIGYVATGLKDVAKAKVGDTITHAKSQTSTPIPGYREAKPMVFAALFPTDSHDFPLLKDSLDKLALNDAALSFETEYSEALGSGFRIGFLGLLHREIVQERLEREYNLSLIASLPTVIYEIKTTKNEKIYVKRPSKFPDPSRIKTVWEPFVKATIITPREYLGGIMDLVSAKRGEIKNIEYQGKQVILSSNLPLAEIVIDFYDRLKNLSSGFASFDYEFLGMRQADVVKLDIFVAKEPIDALSQIVVVKHAPFLGRKLVEKLKDVIPRQQFEVAIQAAIQGKIVARADIPAFRKDVTSKLYGGDRTRKDKLLEAQKKGKKRMKTVGRVEIPQEAFLSLLRL